MKKIISLLLAVAMLFTLAAACGQSSSEEQSSTPASSTPASSDAGNEEEPLTVNKYGWEVPAETITLTYYTCESEYGGSQEEEDAQAKPVHDWLLAEFNVEINKIVYKQEDDGTERINLMLASNDYPECIAHMPDASAEQFIAQGRAYKLNDVLEQYAPDLLAGYGNYINLLKNDEGELYKLAARWGNTTDEMGKDFAVRYDWWLELDVPMYDSFETYYEVIKACVENHPTNEDGEKVYGFSAFTLKGEEFYQASLAYMGFKGTSTGYYKENADGSITHWVDTEEGLTVAKFINRFWRDGLIDPDFQTKDYDQSVAFMSTNRVAGNIGTWWHNYVGGINVWSTTVEDYDPNYRMVCVTFEETDTTPALISDNFIRTTRLILTDKCTDEQAINYAKWWNWESSQIGQVMAAEGVPEGEYDLWHLDENGDIVVNDDYFYASGTDVSWQDMEEQSGAFAYWMQAPAYMALNREPDAGYSASSPVGCVNVWDFVSDAAKLDMDRLHPTTAKTKEVVAEFTDPYLWDQTMWTISFDPDSEELTIQQNMLDLIPSLWAKVVMSATEDECVANFNAMKDQLHQIGLDKVVAAQQAAYSANVAKFNGEF